MLLHYLGVPDQVGFWLVLYFLTCVGAARISGPPADRGVKFIAIWLASSLVWPAKPLVVGLVTVVDWLRRRRPVSEA